MRVYIPAQSQSAAEETFMNTLTASLYILKASSREGWSRLEAFSGARPPGAAEAAPRRMKAGAITLEKSILNDEVVVLEKNVDFLNVWLRRRFSLGFLLLSVCWGKTSIPECEGADIYNFPVGDQPLPMSWWPVWRITAHPLAFSGTLRSKKSRGKVS